MHRSTGNLQDPGMHPWVRPVWVSFTRKYHRCEQTGQWAEINEPDEIQRYLQSHFTVECQEDVLVFWRGQCSAYPLLYMLTLELLCIPAKSSSSEHAVSSAGRVLRAHRNRLNPGTVDFFSTVRPNTRLKHWVVWYIRLLFCNSPPLRCDKCFVHVWERGSSFIPLIFHLLFLA